MDLLFVLKKLLGALLMPSAMLFLVLLIAWCFYRKGFSKLAKVLGLSSIVMLCLLSLGPVADIFLKPLENHYSAYQGQDVDYVVVLGGWHVTNSERPLSSQLSRVSLNRLTEGVMIYRANPGSKLLLSGASGSDSVTHARTAANMAIAMGVPASDIALAEDARDTADEAMHWVEYAGDKRLALVTTASHIPRAVYLFEQAMEMKGLRLKSLVPSPTDYRACVDRCFRWQRWLPAAHHLANVEVAWHEYLGLLWAHLVSKHSN